MMIYFWRNAGGVSVLSIVLLALSLLCGACSDGLSIWTDEASGNKICIGGIETDAMTVSGISSRAAGVNAETIDWLLKPLKDGIDIKYGLYNKTPGHDDFAILKLEDSDKENVGDPDYDVEHGLAVYSLRYRNDYTSRPEIDSENNAIWYDNGFHYFQGSHVPGRIRYNNDDDDDDDDPSTSSGQAQDDDDPAKVVYGEGGTAAYLVTDQHNGNASGTDAQLGNYTLLSHYLGMPPNYRLTATVERIMLPFRHRLARVVAFILIDPKLQTTLKGYKKDAAGNATTVEDPTTTSFRFCNVKVLKGVQETGGEGEHHDLIPTWGVARKVIPHFEGEKGSYSYKTNECLDESGFKYYYKEDDNSRTHQLFPTSKGWEAVHDAAGHNGYTEVNYGKVPVYDIIVRPTYTTVDSVMYDEKDYATMKSDLAAEKNKIDFEIELENGLRYEKRFEFDLNANYQTVVYLRISREHVDYNDAGSDLWIEEKNTDGWYGVDNANGNTLSFAGSSWQRAYTYGAEATNGTEDHTNPHATEGVTDGHFYNASSTADERENAQYFTSDYQNIWVKKFLQACEGGDHHGDYFVLQQDIEIDARLIPENFVFTGHLDGQDHVITLAHAGETVVDKEAWDENHYEVATETDYSSTLYVIVGECYVAYTMPQLYIKDSEDTYVEAHPTITELMGSTTYYSDDTGTVYSKPTLYANHPIHHDAITHESPAYLFAGLNGIYTTAQESNPSTLVWEANVHRETNNFGDKTHWVPTLGYRAEVINVKVADSATLFEEGASITGNVQNCWSKWTGDKATSVSVPNNTPAIPQYK